MAPRRAGPDSALPWSHRASPGRTAIGEKWWTLLAGGLGSLTLGSETPLGRAPPHLREHQSRKLAKQVLLS